MKHHLIRAAAIGFILFIISAVIIANRGEGGNWWSFIHDIPYGDKVGHVGLMGTLCFLCNLAFPCRSIKLPSGLVTPATLTVFTLVSLEELSQAFIPSRSCDLFDWLADIAGIILGQTAALLILRRQKAASEN
ncbi:MAG: VanZ family protein [Akkermansiaceae bacterium]|nr:VanZ family protein [Akkermansiaceae bacterium]MDP4721212.1 VanZ family protein [Akkermansiaceae bacterium]MDP4846939.1 VanZ family protein [Akkermansiaceae bacterium]MDP4994680.1 VanZ family protein [Akkermansiaceae bacterium]